MSIDVASLGVQIHGGMGYIEETGAAQYLRDARILTIYEGTTAIQANDLVSRKTARDGGATAMAIAAAIEATELALQERNSTASVAVLAHLRAARRAFLDVVDFVVANHRTTPNAVFAGGVPYLMLAGKLVAGWHLARSLLVAETEAASGNDPDFMAAKVMTARFYAEHVLNALPAIRDSIVSGSDSVTALKPEQF